MTPEQQRIDIHEALGWTKVIEGPNHYAWKRGDEFHYVASTPDYHNDLNAMHEAEKLLTDLQWDTYTQHLLQLMPYLSGQPDRLSDPAHSTAAQRAEAFLRTLNLWKD